MKVISRAEALNSGLKRYFTGNPCKHGHVAERIASSRKCVACNRAFQSKLLRSSPERLERALERFSRADPSGRVYNWHNITPERRRAYKRAAYRRNPLDQVLRVMLRRTLAGRVKRGSTYDVLGYSQEDLRNHIERQFTKGMSWDNYGEWHIDHITPIAEYLRNGETDPAVINCLTNLRPMWAGDNIRKGDTLTCLL